VDLGDLARHVQPQAKPGAAPSVLFERREDPRELTLVQARTLVMYDLAEEAPLVPG
jgi:hypothetical protein